MEKILEKQNCMSPLYAEYIMAIMLQWASSMTTTNVLPFQSSSVETAFYLLYFFVLYETFRFFQRSVSSRHILDF